MVASKMAAAAGARPELREAESQAWRELIESRVGIHFSEARTHQLTSALWRRMRELEVTSYASYFKLAEAEAEWAALLESLTNRETHFFRHEPTYRALREQLLPKWLAEPAGISLWSAGCSTGEEAYSLAMVCEEAAAGRSFSILASDVSAGALEKAAAGRYGERAVVEVPRRYRRYVAAVAGGQVQVTPEIRGRVRWARVNLTREAAYPGERFDAIVCQNVLVYFRAEVRQRVVAQLAARLKPGGYLLPGPGELAGLEGAGLRCQCWGDMQVFGKPAAAALGY
jgi:type IV pilus assembly protein PilK